MDRVSRSRPCLVCGHGDWCFRSNATHTLHCCMRVHGTVEGMRAIGTNRAGATTYVTAGESPRPPHLRLVRPPVQETPAIDWSRAQKTFEVSLTPHLRDELETQLGIPVGFCLALGLGWCQWQDAWTWPMRNAAGAIVGIQLRRRNGTKAAIKGSRMGLYHIGGLRDIQPVYVCEGPSDTAAMLSLGFEAIGRPSCRGCEDYVESMTRGREVIVVSDADGPGREGADALAKRLSKVCKQVKVIEPVGVKDARDWVKANATRDLVESVVRSAVAV